MLAKCEADASAAFVRISKASLRYGEADRGSPVLDDLSLDLCRGEFAAVVGPSGCGKSSLMKLVSGLVQPSDGTVTVGGAPVTRPLNIVGMAFQNPALLPWRTALENILLPIEVVEPYRRAYRRQRESFVERARNVLAMVDLASVADRYGWQLSGGMQQRVSLCRALIHEPDILLLDEPFGALDAFTREELWDTLLSLWQKRRCTVLLVTHDLAEAVYLADTVHVISRRPGRVVHSTHVDLPRPRTADIRFTPCFAAHVANLRTHVGRAREAA